MFCNGVDSALGGRLSASSNKPSDMSVGIVPIVNDVLATPLSWQYRIALIDRSHPVIDAVDASYAVIRQAGVERALLLQRIEDADCFVCQGSVFGIQMVVGGAMIHCSRCRVSKGAQLLQCLSSEGS